MTEAFRTKIWDETPSTNPFIAQACRCHGYDVYSDLLEHCNFSEYLYLILTGKRLPPSHSKALNALMIALAHPGIRDPSVRASMNAGVGGSRAAAGLMAALAVGAGQFSGARDLKLALQIHNQAGKNFEIWTNCIQKQLQEHECDVWLELDHIPGFSPHQSNLSTPAAQTLQYCSAQLGEHSHTAWIQSNVAKLEQHVGYGMSMVGVSASILFDLEFTPDQAEYFFLIVRLPGAAAQGLEARQNGFRAYPFFGDALELTNDPGTFGANPNDPK